MKQQFVIIIISVFCFFILSFQESNPYFRITQQDITLNIPSGFPKPFYNFENNPLKPEVFILGRKLFYDPILSRDSTISCASCHIRLAAFGHFDHQLSHGINGLIGKRNVPPLQNLIWKDTYMWDGGVNHLEIQPISPITNPIEMNETINGILLKLSQNANYKEDFLKAYGDTIPTSEKVLKSLAQFTGLMISANSKYDRFIQGTDTFSNEEKTGLRIFRAKCVACHSEPLFTNNTYKSNGLPIDTSLKDLGRGAITGIDTDNYKFKVPSLRNIDMTYPYMHDGRFRNMNDVLNYYSHQENFGKYQSPEMKKVDYLSVDDKKYLIAFLHTLTDKTFLYDRRFIDPFMK